VLLKRKHLSTGSGMDDLVNTDLLRDRNKAFEHFRKSYRKNEAIEENKAILKKKYSSAKALAAQVRS
jgi:kinesin family protein 6/9